MYKADMEVALDLATRSPDPSTQNGAVIVDEENGLLGCGWNDFPDAVVHRLGRPEKYSYIEHAERSAIYDVAKTEFSTRGSTMICPWAACCDCARAIACAEISKLVRLPLDEYSTHGRWSASCLIGDIILKEAGVEIIEFTDLDKIMIPELKRNEEIWRPYVST